MNLMMMLYSGRASLNDVVLKPPVDHGLAHRFHLGALDCRLCEVAVRVLCDVYGGCWQLCCLGADSLVGNLEILILKLLSGLSPFTAGGTGCILVLEHDGRCRCLLAHGR